MKKHRTQRLRLKLNPNETVTISGLNYADAKMILTLASLANYQAGKDVEAKRNTQENRNLVTRRHWIIDTLTKQLDADIRATHGKPVVNKASRLETVKETRNTRLLIEGILKEC